MLQYITEGARPANARSNSVLLFQKDIIQIASNSSTYIITLMT